MVHLSSKLKELNLLADCIAALKTQGKKIVLCHGVFDLLHIGHIRHFEEAKTLGDILIVTVTPDEFVNKGLHRPAFPQSLRAEALAALSIVDYVAINRWPNAVETIRLLKPNVYAKGPDYKEAAKDVTGGILLEEEAIRAVGGKIYFTGGATFSASHLLNRHLPIYPDEVSNHLGQLREKYSAETMIHLIEKLKSLKVLVIGEAILDEYVYCDALGKSAKEAILAMRYLNRETHAGGSLAVANHLADFCKEVHLLTYLGEINSQRDFILSQLKPNVKPTFVTKSKSPTIVKRRYVENYLLSKVLEIYEMDSEYLNEKENETLCVSLREKLAQCDLAIASDFGHGLITPQVSEMLCARAPFLAVNAQNNAANIGFHTISKYRRADYVCAHEVEMRLDQRNRKGDLKELMRHLAERLLCKSVMVTLGKRGTILYDTAKGFFECPAFAIKVVDRIGAGDAVLALTSLCVAKEFPPDVTNFLGNLAASQAVMTLGNRTSIDKIQMLKSIEAFLK